MHANRLIACIADHACDVEQAPTYQIILGRTNVICDIFATSNSHSYPIMHQQLHETIVHSTELPLPHL